MIQARQLILVLTGIVFLSGCTKAGDASVILYRIDTDLVALMAHGKLEYKIVDTTNISLEQASKISKGLREGYRAYMILGEEIARCGARIDGQLYVISILKDHGMVLTGAVQKGEKIIPIGKTRRIVGTRTSEALILRQLRKWEAEAAIGERGRGDGAAKNGVKERKNRKKMNSGDVNL